jgi:hypothetical protein
MAQRSQASVSAPLQQATVEELSNRRLPGGLLLLPRGRTAFAAQPLRLLPVAVTADTHQAGYMDFASALHGLNHALNSDAFAASAAGGARPLLLPRPNASCRSRLSRSV